MPTYTHTLSKQVSMLSWWFMMIKCCSMTTCKLTNDVWIGTTTIDCMLTAMSLIIQSNEFIPLTPTNTRARSSWP